MNISSNLLGIIGIITTIVAYTGTFIILWRRSGHQISNDDSATMKAINESAEMAATARLRAEKERAGAENECEFLRRENEALRIKMKNIRLRLILDIAGFDEPVFVNGKVEAITDSKTEV